MQRNCERTGASLRVAILLVRGACIFGHLYQQGAFIWTKSIDEEIRILEIMYKIYLDAMVL